MVGTEQRAAAGGERDEEGVGRDTPRSVLRPRREKCVSSTWRTAGWLDGWLILLYSRREERTRDWHAPAIAGRSAGVASASASDQTRRDETRPDWFKSDQISSGTWPGVVAAWKIVGDSHGLDPGMDGWMEGRAAGIATIGITGPNQEKYHRHLVHPSIDSSRHQPSLLLASKQAASKLDNDWGPPRRRHPHDAGAVGSAFALVTGFAQDNPLAPATPFLSITPCSTPRLVGVFLS